MTIFVLIVLVLGSAAAAEKPSSDMWPKFRVLLELVSRPDKIATTRWQKMLSVEEKKTGVTARKQQNLIERSVQEKAAAVIIKQAVIQALMAGGAQATKKIGVKTTSYRDSGIRQKQFSPVLR